MLPARREQHHRLGDAVVLLAAIQREGFDVRAFQPRRAEAEDMKNATRIVSIDCNVEVAGAPLERWDDVPKVSVDLEGSAAAIRKHVETLAAQLR